MTPEIRITVDLGVRDAEFGGSYHLGKMLRLIEDKHPQSLAFKRPVVFNAFVEGRREPVAGAFLQLAYDFAVTEVGWVEPEFAAHGLGRRLFEEVEGYAKRAGCQRLIATSIGFYDSEGYITKMGFEVFARLEDCPKGSELIYYQKRI